MWNNIIIPEPSICDCVTNIWYCVILCHVMLIPNPKSENKKINKIKYSIRTYFYFWRLSNTRPSLIILNWKVILLFSLEEIAKL